MIIDTTDEISFKKFSQLVKISKDKVNLIEELFKLKKIEKQNNFLQYIINAPNKI